MIFVWTILILAGLLGLLVEFYRVTPKACPKYDDGSIVSPHPAAFRFEQANCGMVCDEVHGPHSPMRGGPAKNVYIIPQPTFLSFNTAMLLAAACCIPAILSLLFTLDKILEINWKDRFGYEDDAHLNEPIEGTNGATPGKMRSVNEMVRRCLSVIEIPVFGGAVVAIVCLGEANFFSEQLMYQTEPIASVGK